MISTLLFQFTPLREGRHAADAATIQAAIISIHAPPRGATCRCIIAVPGGIFQFTPLREGRRRRRLLFCPPQRYFNSRPSARGDCMMVFPDSHRRTFQFTPLREGRLLGVVTPAISLLFQFTPLREGRLRCKMYCMLPADFNSRPSARGDLSVRSANLAF